MTGVERSAVYRIAPDNTVETLWSSKEENVYDIALDGTGLLLATDRDGRVYRLDAQGRANLLAQTEQGQATGVLPLENGFLAATGNEGKLFRFTAAPSASNPASPATYESPVHDAQSVSRWGSLSWAARGQAPANAGMRILTRAGNSFRPDNTWSDWQPIDLTAGGRIQSPNARYLQWKAEFPATAGTSAPPALERVTVAYLPQNAAPLVKAVRVASQLKASSNTGTAASQAAAAASTAAYSITVSATGEGEAAGPAGSTIASTNRLVEPAIQCTWEAEDPDGDTLEYELSYRAEDETAWKPLASSIRETTYAVDASRFADGRYYFRVVATDAPDNSPGVAKQNELISVPVVLDHSAPAIEILNRERGTSGWSLRVRVRDAASMVRRVEISVNAKPLQVVLPIDGIADSLAEEFVIAISDDTASAAEKSVVIKATDASGNVATARVLLTSQP
jgi:hypothetical protein